MASVSDCLPATTVIRRLGVRICLVLLIGTLLDTSNLASAASPALSPAYWKQRLFFIPYQLNKIQGTPSQIAKVQLLVSQDGTTGWKVLQEAAPNVRGFGYHAPEDGEYWFALRHLDQQGNPWPTAAIQAQMRIQVDTIKPQLKVNGTLGDSGTIKLHYESRDANLRPESLIVEARTAGGTWSRVPLGPPTVSQSELMQGEATWTYPHTTKSIEIRASISDQVGHRAETSNQVAVAGPALQMPIAENGSAGNLVDPFQSASRLPAHNWPENNRLPRAGSSLASPAAKPHQNPHLRPLPSIETPPLANPYTAAHNHGGNDRTPARLIGDAGSNVADAETETALAGDSIWAPPQRPMPQRGPADRMVNSLAFDVEYDLQAVGPWGVSKVEIWGTHDDGRSWQSYCVDQDNRSPVRVTVPGEGVYGFRILVDGANGVGATPPRSGEKPELVVAVDLQAPRAEILSTQLGQGNLADHLLLRWSVADGNLEQRPIGLYYSAYPNGPWSTIAAGLENTGNYTWRLERHMPNQFYVRLEVRDLAGNLATHQSSEPISLARPQPTGRLRGVQPIGPSRDF